MIFVFSLVNSYPPHGQGQPPPGPMQGPPARGPPQGTSVEVLSVTQLCIMLCILNSLSMLLLLLALISREMEMLLIIYLSDDSRLLQ